MQYRKENIDLSDGLVFVISTDFLNTSEKFIIEKAGEKTPVEMDEYVRVESIQIDCEESWNIIGEIEDASDNYT